MYYIKSKIISVVCAVIYFSSLYSMHTTSPTVIGSHEKAIWLLAWHSGGVYLASYAVDQSLKVWNMQTNCCVHQLKAEHRTLHLHWEHDNRLVAELGMYGKQEWVIKNDQECQPLPFNPMTPSPDRYKDSAEEEKEVTALGEIYQHAKHLAYNPARTFAVVGLRTTAEVFLIEDDQTGRTEDGLIEYPLQQPGSLNSAAWSPDGTMVALLWHNGAITIADVSKRGTECWQTMLSSSANAPGYF